MSVEVPGGGVVSVVIAAYDVVDYLAETLDSVLAQDGVDLEVVVVDDGSTDGTGELADEVAARDDRVRVIHQPNAGLGAARNAGIAAAGGEFLAFCDADDVLPPGALATHLAALRESGSDLAVGRIHRLLPDRTHQEPVWVTEAHAAAPLRGVRVDEHPLVIKDIVACNRVYRRSAWDARVGTFPVGVAYEDHVPMLVSYLAGARIDVLDEVTYLWRTRPDLSSISQRKAEDANFADRLAVMGLAWDAVQREEPAVRSMWLARALELDLAGYYRHAGAASTQFRQRLHEAAAHYLELADDDALRFVSVHRKVSAWLAAGEHWDALAWLESREHVASLRRHGELVDGWPTARPGPLATRFGLAVPEHLRALSSFDTTARAALRAVRQTASTIEVELDVWLRGVKRPDGLDEVGLVLRHGALPPLHVPARVEGRRARATIDAAALRDWADDATGTLSVAVRYAWGDASGEAPVPGVATAFGPARTAGARASLDGAGMLVLRLTPEPVPTTRLRIRRGEAVATLADPPGKTQSRSAAGRAHAAGSPDAAHGHEPRREVRVALPDRARRRVVPRVGAARLAWPEDDATGVVVPRGPRTRRSPWRWEATARGEAVVVPRRPLLELTSATADDDGLTLTLVVRDPWRLDVGSLRWFPGRARVRRRRVTVRLDAQDLAAITAPAPLTATEPGRRSPATVRFAWSMLDAGPMRWEIQGRVVRLRAGRRRAVLVSVRKPR